MESKNANEEEEEENSDRVGEGMRAAGAAVATRQLKATTGANILHGISLDIPARSSDARSLFLSFAHSPPFTPWVRSVRTPPKRKYTLSK